MTTTVQSLLDQLAAMTQENRGDYGGTNWSTGLWTITEIIGYINDTSRDFILRSQISKLVTAIQSVTGQRIYADRSYTMQTDRIAFNRRPLYRTNRTLLDRQSPKWRTLSGVPRQYHQDQLSTKEFEADRAPTSAMTGSGYTPSGLYGPLREMSGSYTYTATIPAAGRGGIFRYAYGTRAYNGFLRSVSPYAGVIRELLSGLTNFEIIATRLVDEVTDASDVLSVPDYTVLYIKLGVLSRMFAKEGEAQDMARSRYCEARYEGGIALLSRLMDATFDTRMQRKE